jgi:hypothetical protein
MVVVMTITGFVIATNLYEYWKLGSICDEASAALAVLSSVLAAERRNIAAVESLGYAVT